MDINIELWQTHDPPIYTKQSLIGKIRWYCQNVFLKMSSDSKDIISKAIRVEFVRH